MKPFTVIVDYAVQGIGFSTEEEAVAYADKYFSGKACTVAKVVKKATSVSLHQWQEVK